ncbi:VTT domain-containing protein [Terriglobus sp. ADX1]|uniref:VTT domain-containing protein n=1 Tax=Terriglobus sp. ADX1 TaxID=2794063 RepID=UPI002FE6135C
MTSEVNQLTYGGIFLAVFAQQFCLPVPSMFFLMTAGALLARGDHHLSCSLVLLCGMLGCLFADLFWFWLGRHWGSRVIRVVCSFTSDPARSRARAHEIFDRWGLRLLVFAKFVPGLDGVSPPVAAAEGASLRGFLFYDAIGSTLWSGSYIMVGFLFSNQIDSIMRWGDHFGRVAVLVIGLPMLLYATWRGIYIFRMIRHLRLRRISPARLQARLDNGDPIAVFDLLKFEAQMDAIPGIPGALRVDPTRLRNAREFSIPAEVDVVLYCSSRGSFASARVAQALKKRGMTRVWVLEGGLEAWTLDGHPTTAELSTREEIAGRLGILLPSDLH